MATVTFITGGARSGKSSFAQQLAEQRSGRPVYLATARIMDADFARRVERHRADRGPQWETVEQGKWLSTVVPEGRTVVVDCLTLWLTNFFFDLEQDVDKTLEQARTEWTALLEKKADLIVVSNELGMGVHPENELARKFADVQGWMNQYVARRAGEVYLMVSGIAVKIK
ncbi:MAG: bifunctional adenosylcobinamide kinase/adenosylcobinamide-phosphate guanylyltransferase [Mangrovibacterium sp.]